MIKIEDNLPVEVIPEVKTTLTTEELLQALDNLKIQKEILEQDILNSQAKLVDVTAQYDEALLVVTTLGIEIK